MFLQLDNLDLAVNKIEKNQIVGIPTETVYGIGVNPNSQVAVENLFKIKKRAVNNTKERERISKSQFCN